MQTVESRPRATRHPDRRSAVLAVLRSTRRPLRVDEVAAAVGTADSTAQFHLSMLVNAGLAVRAPLRRGSAGRPSWQYDAAPEPGPAPYQELARVLAAQLGEADRAAAAAREAGRRWAAHVPAAREPAADAADAVARLAAVLDGLGFAPPPAPDLDEIVLRACPVEAVARENRAVVCGVHLGLVERTAAVIGGGIAVAGLEPFRSERPLACAVRLRHQAGRADHHRPDAIPGGAS